MAVESIDWAEVKHLFTIGCTIEQAAVGSGVSRSTFYKKAEEEGINLAEMKSKYLAEGQNFVKKQLWVKIKNGDLGAIIFWQKNHDGMSENTQSELKIEIVQKDIKEK